jgi:hypothetical protein
MFLKWQLRTTNTLTINAAISMNESKFVELNA